MRIVGLVAMILAIVSGCGNGWMSKQNRALDFVESKKICRILSYVESVGGV